MNVPTFLAGRLRGVWIFTILLILFLLLQFAFLFIPSSPPDHQYLIPQQEPTSLDINQLDSTEWVAFRGIGPVLARRILTFKASRGGFLRPLDLAKVYGLDSSLSLRLQSKLCYSPSDSLPPLTFHSKKTVYIARKKRIKVPLNTANASELKKVRGIGDVLSKRIVKYRELIGFYYRKEQLMAVYGLSKENYVRMTPELSIKLPPEREKKSLNLTTINQLARYSTISRSLAKKIVRFRSEIGKFEFWNQLFSVEGFAQNNLEEIKVYYKIGKP
ncbi:MAG: helix-hairpin-helix domain-containing protein [Bacteroidota bacterium]